MNLDEILDEIYTAEGDSLLSRAEAKQAIQQHEQQAIVTELNKIWRVAVDNDVAGPVKWELEDRIKALSQSQEKEQTDG